MTRDTRTALSAGRRRLLQAIALLLPLLVLGLAETALRLADQGDTYPLFVPIPGAEAEGWQHVNPRVVQRFVLNPASTPKLWIRPVAFQREKSPDVFRIFVQGESTAEGYPYGYGASPAGMLQQRLQRTFPERRIEVITTAVSAVTSYTLLDFADEIVAQRPDAIVIYAGHNEYLGLLGPASTYSAGRAPLVRLFLALRPLRLFQVLRSGMAALTPQPAADDPRTLMERVVARQQIAYGSTLYLRGLEQYRRNLDTLLARYAAAKVPVFIGTLISNERDQPPFISGHTPDVDVALWRRHFDAGVAALRARDPGAALAAFDAALAVDGLHADTYFGRARALDALDRHAEAHEAYVAAKERDELRFRAPGAINAILREVAAQHGAHVVDVEAAFHAASRDGIVGADLMLEHLHPNLDGYFVLADAFYDALREHPALAPWDHAVVEEQARLEMPVTEVDRLYGEYRIAALTAGWPFSRERRRFRLPEPRGPVENIAQGYFEGRMGWPDAMRELLDHYRQRGDGAQAASVAALLADAFPYRMEDQKLAAHLLREAGRSDFTGYLAREADANASSGTAR